ncbi:hypothetical protein F4811DRAFT_553715 [Daldinia bambusicola]|nr:hypothetical protein F4811DRAFT_553715 [Daldinia bambusicola]
MKIIVSLVGVLGVVSAAVAGDEVGDLNTSFPIPPGYTVVPFSMDLVLEPGGEPMTFNGTVTEILAQVQSINPNFTWENSVSATTSVEEIHKWKRSKSKILCNIPGYSVGLRWIVLKGYDYLKNLHQACKVDAGPRKCSMIYCEAGTSIWMCNDNTTPISRDCDYIATYALDIVAAEKCQSPGPTGAGVWTNGQEFDTDNFNVIAAGGGCN